MNRSATVARLVSLGVASERAARMDLSGAYLTEADLTGADLSAANLRAANLTEANLTGATLRAANLTRADLTGADLTRADLTRAYLTRAYLTGADLTGAIGLVKCMGVEVGNCYWKRFGAALRNNEYQYWVGLNALRDGEVFASDERVRFSYPGFHFASRSWCSVNLPDMPLEARIRIPEGAQINEPWATDGKASADRIEILQVFDVVTGADVTDQFRRAETPLKGE